MNFDFDEKVSDASPMDGRQWRGMIRAESQSGNPEDITKAIQLYQPEKLIYAEGDSWFDKFTPIPSSGTNLLSTIRLPFLTVVADVSHIGDESADLVKGHQALRTRAIFDFHQFDAIILSAGGNDLKNIFTEMFQQRARQRGASSWSEADLAALADPETYSDALNKVSRNIRSFIRMRDAGKSTKKSKPPLFFHSYDYLQPRPAGAMIFAHSRIGRGPWIYPGMHAAGLTTAQMRSSVDAVIDQLHHVFKAVALDFENVYLIDQRGLLTPARETSTGEDEDWFDEIHPNERGFRKLASERWEVPLAQALGWQASSTADLSPAAVATNASTARAAVKTA